MIKKKKQIQYALVIMLIFGMFSFFTGAELCAQKTVAPICTDSDAKDNLFTVSTFRTNLTSGTVELFEGPFPPGGWQLINPNAGSMTFVQYSGANGPSIGGNKSVQMPFYDYSTQNHRDTLKTPLLANPVIDDTLFFDWAYQYYPNSSYYDSLFVLISTDGGLTFPISVFRRGGPSLATAGANSSPFVPTQPSQWQRFAYPLNELSNVVVAFATLNRYGNNLYIDNVVLGKQKNYDVTVTGFSPLKPDTNYLFGDSLFQIIPKITVSNIGRNNIETPFNLHLNISSLGYSQTLSIPMLNSGSSTTIDFPDLLFTNGSELNIECFVNYALDENPSNDTLRQNSIVFRGTSRALVLYEQWTSSTCGPCATNNPTIDAFIAARSDSIVATKYHVGWPSPGNDPMYLHNPTQSYERRYYYGVNSVPSIWVDGQIQPVYPYTTANSLLNPFIRRLATPTPVSSVIVTSTRPAVDTIRTEVTVNILSPIRTQTYLRMQVIEKVINYATPPGTNGEKTFYDVFRLALPSTQGIMLPSDPGTYSYTFTLAIHPVWVDTNIYAIAFIQNDHTKEVYGAGKSQTTTYTIDVDQDNPNPYVFDLEQNYPNPFNPATAIYYTIPEPARVRLIVYNSLGQKVRELVNTTQPAGRYQIIWNGKNDKGQTVSSGIYFYRLIAGRGIAQKKMLLLK